MGSVIPLRAILTNSGRSLAAMFPNFFGTGGKHDHYVDFGYPEVVTFDMTYRAYRRMGIARAAVDKTITKTWQDHPWLQDHQRDSGGPRAAETPLEKSIRQRFEDIRLWQSIADADGRSMVGRYSALILRLADGRPFDQPVGPVSGGLEGLVEVIPVWENQLSVQTWDMDTASETYGQPLMFSFKELEPGARADARPRREVKVHPDRVVIWSRNGTMHCTSALEPGYNDLLTIEKIIGAGGEGFWKNAKSAPVFEVDKEASIDRMAAAMGVRPDEVLEKMNEQVEAYQKGFDQLLMVQGMQAKSLGVSLPSPEHFFAVALQSFAASVQIPMKILLGTQTGERASSEDAAEWSLTCQSRRTNQVRPSVMELVRRLERFGVLPEQDWWLEWTDLTEATLGEKISRADKMATVNQKMRDTGELVFLPEEIREVVDLEPIAEEKRFRDEPGDDEVRAALDITEDEPPEAEQ